MKEICAPGKHNRYLPGRINGEAVLNPDRIERFFVRGKTKKDCIDILEEHANMRLSYKYLQNYGQFWGNYVNRPEFEGRGLWAIRDHNDQDLITIWTEENQ